MGCPPQVRKQLMAVEGVESVEVNYTTKVVTCNIKKEANQDTVKASLKTALKDQYSFAGWQ